MAPTPIKSAGCSSYSSPNFSYAPNNFSIDSSVPLVYSAIEPSFPATQQQVNTSYHLAGQPPAYHRYIGINRPAAQPRLCHPSPGHRARAPQYSVHQQAKAGFPASYSNTMSHHQNVQYSDFNNARSPRPPHPGVWHRDLVMTSPMGAPLRPDRPAFPSLGLVKAEPGVAMPMRGSNAGYPYGAPLCALPHARPAQPHPVTCPHQTAPIHDPALKTDVVDTLSEMEQMTLKEVSSSEGIESTPKNWIYGRISWEIANRSASYLQNYCRTGDSRFLVYNLRHLIGVQDENGLTSLQLAVAHKQVLTLINLLRVINNIPRKVDILEYQDNNDHQTALHMACMNADHESVRLLVAAGASANARDKNGNTPLHCAVIVRSSKCIFELSNSPLINFNHRNFEGRTALHMATYSGNLLLMKDLLSLKHVNPDMEETTSGKTPLHIAASEGFLQIVAHLVIQNVDCGVQDRSGNSPRQLAAENGHRHVVDYFRTIVPACPSPKGGSPAAGRPMPDCDMMEVSQACMTEEDLRRQFLRVDDWRSLVARLVPEITVSGDLDDTIEKIVSRQIPVRDFKAAMADYASEKPSTDIGSVDPACIPDDEMCM